MRMVFVVVVALASMVDGLAGQSGRVTKEWVMPLITYNSPNGEVQKVIGRLKAVVEKGAYQITLTNEWSQPLRIRLADPQIDGIFIAETEENWLYLEPGQTGALCGGFTKFTFTDIRSIILLDGRTGKTHFAGTLRCSPAP